MSELKRTPLFHLHQAAGAKMIPFGGWEMPVQYSGILEEHRAVRQAAGIFDLSHMGEFYVQGPGAYDYLNRLLTNKLAKLEPGKAQYNLLCREDGGVLDDLILYRLDKEIFLVVVNAANIDKDWDWFQSHLPSAGVELINATDDTALIAVQGPHSEEILAKVTPVDVAGITPFTFQKGRVSGIDTLIAATGYTGERGFELYLDASEAETVWNKLLEAGSDLGLVPVGLGARDTLRLEMAYSLYGQELTVETTPLEAGLNFAVKLDKGDFIGRAALQKQAEEGIKRRLVGFKMIGRGVPRHGYEILNRNSEVIGAVTSGSFSPTLEENIGLGYVSVGEGQTGNHIWINIRNKAVEAEVVPLPFVKPYYKR
ncbi:MAG: glycine cleavage system aminomethyltransferase GcvT [Firmicutes bacterium]|nr:glycine cleavage system aminomethyltransferase GcvT [Bacillota bacterium]